MDYQEGGCVLQSPTSCHRLGSNRSLSLGLGATPWTPKCQDYLGYCYSPLFSLISVTTCFPGEGADLPAFLVHLMFPSQCSSPSSLSICNVFLGSLGLNSSLRDPLVTCTTSPSSWDAVRRKGFPAVDPSPLLSCVLQCATNCMERWLCVAASWFPKSWFGNCGCRKVSQVNLLVWGACGEAAPSSVKRPVQENCRLKGQPGSEAESEGCRLGPRVPVKFGYGAWETSDFPGGMVSGFAYEDRQMLLLL